MLTIALASVEPFGYRVTGEPEASDPLVEVTFTQSVHRYSQPGPNSLFCTGEGTVVYRQEARWLSVQGVIQESY